MTTIHFTLFDTAIGRCGIAWGEQGVVAVGLPDHSEQRLRARLIKQFPDAIEAAPAAPIALAIAQIVALLRGESRDLTGIVLDMSGVPDFHRQVYEIARTIQLGATLTYGEIARRLGDPGAARAVGQALGRNPFPIIVPCHRVLAAHGKTGGFSADGGIDTKLRMLTIEGAYKAGAPGLFADLPLAAAPARRP